jgi:Na+/phosphate symporter
MNTYENTEKNVNRLVDSQEEYFDPNEDFYQDVYERLKISDRCFDQNIDRINQIIDDYVVDGQNVRQCCIAIERELK